MYQQTLLLGKRKILISAWSPADAKELGVSNWSLQGLQSTADVFEQKKLVTGLCQVFQRLGVQEAHAPNVAPGSAVIVPDYILTRNVRLNKDMCIYRNRDVPADGLFLDKNMSFVMSAAGCPVIIATDDQNVIVAHAGRDSLIDRSAVMGSVPRKHLSVVHSIIDAFKKRETMAHQLEMVMLFCIPTAMFEHKFNHPTHGVFNHALADFIDERWPNCTRYGDDGVFLDLESIFIEQALQAGIMRAYAMKSLSELPDLAHTRDGMDTSRRNLFVVKCNA